jgi:subtilisin family serine protease
LRSSHIKNVTSLSLWTASKDNIVKDHWEIGYFSGYSANIYSSELVSYIAASPYVAHIEPDQIVTKSACAKQTTNTGLWGLNRITTRTILPAEGFQYNDQGGAGVDAYIIDTGINSRHVDFTGRAKLGISYVTSEPTAEDQNGHGTHCAGTIGGNTYGIAKKSTLIGVKVLDRNGSGTLNAIINGCNWVAAQRRSSGRRSTANLSLGSSYSATVNNAVNALWDAGVFVAVAAGNSNANACNYSPASATSPVSVGATDSSDMLTYFSNWGNCVDILAPGMNVLSAWIGSTTATNTISGTSMASPHVAGVATLYMGVNPSATAAQVKNWMIGRAVSVNIGDRRGSPDRLLHNGCY